jgi:hypothetical protein
MGFSRCGPAVTTVSEYPEGTEDTEPVGTLMALPTGMKTVIFGMSLTINNPPSISNRRLLHRLR